VRAATLPFLKRSTRPGATHGEMPSGGHSTLHVEKQAVAAAQAGKPTARKRLESGCSRRATRTRQAEGAAIGGMGETPSLRGVESVGDSAMAGYGAALGQRAGLCGCQGPAYASISAGEGSLAAAALGSWRLGRHLHFVSEGGFADWRLVGRAGGRVRVDEREGVAV